MSDALTVSAEADAILLIVNLARATRPMLVELRRNLTASPAPALGLVIAGAQLDEERGYGYGYGYGYGREVRIVSRRHWKNSMSGIFRCRPNSTP